MFVSLSVPSVPSLGWRCPSSSPKVSLNVCFDSDSVAMFTVSLSLSPSSDWLPLHRPVSHSSRVLSLVSPSGPPPPPPF